MSKLSGLCVVGITQTILFDEDIRATKLLLRIEKTGETVGIDVTEEQAYAVVEMMGEAENYEGTPVVDEVEKVSSI